MFWSGRRYTFRSRHLEAIAGNAILYQIPDSVETALSPLGAWGMELHARIVIGIHTYVPD